MRALPPKITWPDVPKSGILSDLRFPRGSARQPSCQRFFFDGLLCCAARPVGV